MLKKWVKMRFPDHGVNRKVVEYVQNYHNMKFQPKLMQRSRVNGQKPIFWKIAYKKKLRVFLENRASSLFYIYNVLTSCEISEKSNDGKYENFLLLTDRRTDRQTDGWDYLNPSGFCLRFPKMYNTWHFKWKMVVKNFPVIAGHPWSSWGSWGLWWGPWWLEWSSFNWILHDVFKNV